VTFDGLDSVVQALFDPWPDHRSRLPYVYGIVRNPGPIYARLPSRDEMSRLEPGMEARMLRWLNAPGEVGASYASYVWLGGQGTGLDARRAWWMRRSARVPEWLRAGQSVPSLHPSPRDPEQLVSGEMRARVGHAIVRSFLWEGRRFGLSTELELLPTDRLRPIVGSDFAGVEIGDDVEFPFALVRRPVATYRGGEPVPYRAVLPLTGRQEFYGGVLHYETKAGRWVSDRVASRLDAARRMPGWALDDEKWIDVSLSKQTLVLYEGTTAVYATLISSGAGGVGAPAATATRPGIFRIHTKHITATMSSDELGEDFELNDVPYVQYFEKGGMALHAAYWHDGFGQPRSHGCINLSPEDARRIFFWTDPPVPPGWHGALVARRGTVVFVHS
jgi:hypothetical protein